MKRLLAFVFLAAVLAAPGCGGGKGGVEKPDNPAPPPKKEDIKVI